MREAEKEIYGLARGVAGGIFARDSFIRSMGIEDDTTMNSDELAEKLAGKDTVRAAYLADNGQTVEPVMKDKAFNRFGNSALQQLIDTIGAQELARVNAEILTDNTGAVRELEPTVRNIICAAYEEKNRSFLDKKPERKQARIDNFMENNVSYFTVEDFIKDAWKMYKDGGTTKGEIDEYATQDKLRAAVNDEDVKAWVLQKLTEYWVSLLSTTASRTIIPEATG